MPFARKSALLCAAALSLSVACSGNFDTARVKTEPTATLGDEIYTALCDRVGASVLTEDLSGASYHGVCHRNAAGGYASSVDESKLPAVTGADAVRARKLALAKVHAMARRRTDLIKALNATFKEEKLPVPFGKAGETISSHQALSIFLKRMVPLYESNPIDTEGSGATEALMPSVTRAAGRLFAALAGPDKNNPYTEFADADKAAAAQTALAQLSGRQGYRPQRVVLGALRPAMTYPSLRPLTQVFAPRMGPGGAMRSAFQNVLGMSKWELETSVPKPAPGALQIDLARMEPNRPRTNTEIAQAIMLAQNPAFALPGSEPRWLVTRDVRGYAIPAGNQPGIAGTVGGPFFDGDGDGFADVDPLGRFVDGSGVPVAVNTPFFTPNIADLAARDPFGRAVDGAGQPVYAYLNTSEALVASLTRDLVPLLEPDPALEHETLADLLAGAFALYGDSVEKQADWADGGAYQSFNAETSPIADLSHASGWMLAHKNSDLHLKLIKKLFAEHEPLMARVIGAALRIRDIANQYPEIALDPSVTIWDEFAEFTAKLSKDPVLFKDLLRALAHPDVQAYIGTAYSNFNKYRDALHYDTNNVNGPPINETAGGTLDPQTPVNPTAPDAGMERSEFHRILQIIHDVNDVTACNKVDAKVRIKALGLPITVGPTCIDPFCGSGFGECELFVFRNMGVFYLHAILGKANLQIENGFLNFMMDASKLFTDPNKMMEDSAEITGMGLTPTPHALNRLVYFGAESPKFDGFFGGAMPDRDPNWNTTNDTTNKFVSRIVDAVSTSACPERPVQTTKYGTLWLADCNPSLSWQHNASLKGDPKELMRLRNHGTIFTWEKFEFYKAMRPLLKAFDDHGAAELFLESIEILYRHWPSPLHAPEECNKNGDFAQRPWAKYLSDADKAAHKVNPGYNPKYCNESGASKYEPILAQAFITDFLPALGELVKVLDNPNFISDDRAGGLPHSGLDILHETTVMLFDPAYASSVGMRDRAGNSKSKWANGLIENPQLTLFDLFADAMRKIDIAHEKDPARRTRWRRARSQLVDQFLAVNGEGAGAQFKNPAFIKTIPVLIDVLREQVNANCKDRETNPVACQWAVKELGSKTVQTLGDPAFSTTMHLIELINQDPDARRALQEHLKYLIELASDDDALHSTLTSMSDMMQIMGDDEKMPPIYNAIAIAAAPEANTIDQYIKAPGTADRVLELMHAITKETDASGKPAANPYDPYRVMDRILANLFTPMDPADANSQTPIEIFLDTIAEVNREDSDVSRDQPLNAVDFKFVFATMRDFMTNETRGMEQFYEIISHRDGD